MAWGSWGPWGPWGTWGTWDLGEFFIPGPEVVSKVELPQTHGPMITMRSMSFTGSPKQGLSITACRLRAVVRLYSMFEWIARATLCPISCSHRKETFLDTSDPQLKQLAIDDVITSQNKSTVAQKLG